VQSVVSSTATSRHMALTGMLCAELIGTPLNFILFEISNINSPTLHYIKHYISIKNMFYIKVSAPLQGRAKGRNR